MARQENGDTLIEVLFAMAVFALVMVSALVLMNQGVSASQRSLEITTVRQQMDGQAETLRFLHDAYVQAYQKGGTTYTAGSPAAEYAKVLAFVKTGNLQNAASFGGTSACTLPANTPTKKKQDFILNPINATLVTDTITSGVFIVADSYAQLVFSGTNDVTASKGIWVEGIRSPGTTTTPGYTDFHIRACWPGPGTKAPMNLATIVRLYEPRG